MSADSVAAQAEGREVAQHILRNEALHRLAENPLLLTMLLVVKHGAGRLPPDRVSLYSRAVEVLLDTWNIKGHDPLNPKEAVPQLACVAYELLRAGKQTATEKEVLELLEVAREKVPQIQRYAKGTPHDFLKRVELRSSLLVEAGRQRDGLGTVPFYQFRHLTFQEHLAAVAAVEGHYFDYSSGDSVVTPLEPHLTSEEWKEVIPMAAVMARKQAEPLIAALVKRAENIYGKVQRGEDFEEKSEWLRFPTRLPNSIARLMQCFLEEAEAAPDTLARALQLIAFFGRGCKGFDEKGSGDWASLVRGPYGGELVRQVCVLYDETPWHEDAWIMNTCASLLAYQHSQSFRPGREGRGLVKRLIDSGDVAQTARGLLTQVGVLWNAPYAPNEGRPSEATLTLTTWTEIERLVLHHDARVWSAAIWLWAWVRHRDRGPRLAPAEILDRLMALWLNGGSERERVVFALATSLGMPRAAWSPTLDVLQRQIVRIEIEAEGPSERDADRGRGRDYGRMAALSIAFYARNVLSDTELGVKLRPYDGNHKPWSSNVRPALRQMRALARRSAKAKGSEGVPVDSEANG
jgi:hypothetical protein